MDDAHIPQTVSTQEADPNGLLHHYRAMISGRRTHPALHHGTKTDMRAQGNVLTFQRIEATETLFCALNMGGTPSHIRMPSGAWHPIMGEALGPSGELAPWACAILQKTNT